jgi:hypothetical protein
MQDAELFRTPNKEEPHAKAQRRKGKTICFYFSRSVLGVLGVLAVSFIRLCVFATWREILFC